MTATDPATVRREAMEEASRIADKRQTMLEAKGRRHPDNSPSREACAQAAYEAMWLASAIRGAATRPAEATGDVKLVETRQRLREIVLGWSGIDESDLGPIVEAVMREVVIPGDFAGSAKRVAELEAEVDRLGKLVYVPGLWRCPKCKFTLSQFNLNGLDGAVTSRDDPGDKCPNCDKPLWRVTERDAGNDMVDRAEEQLARALAAEARAEQAERERDEAIEGARQRGVLDDIERKGAIRLAREAIAKQRAAEARAQAVEAEAGRLRAAARTLVERANERAKGERTAVVNEVIVPIDCIRNLWNALASQGPEAVEPGDRG